MLRKSVVISFIGLLLVTFPAWAGSSVLEGFVKDATGRPIKDANIRIEGNNFSKTTKTNAKGHYVCDGLGVGTYKVSLIMNGRPKASILDAKTQSNKPTQLNFGLTGKLVATKHTHMVWIPPDINTHIGAGHWVEVDDNGNIVDGTGVSSVEKVQGPAVQQMQIRVAPAH
jgi:hypothetical protein